MVRELGLAEILDSIQAESVKEREAGFADLRYALDFHRKKNGLQDLKDKSVHHVFETLFHVAAKERSNYAKAARPTVKATSAARLSACAAALRSTTTFLVHRVRLKTLRAYLAHIVQVLPYADEGLCKPLTADYVKALATLLEYQPHVEHFSHEDWRNTVDFCLEAIVSLDEDATESISVGDSLLASRTSDVPSQFASGRPVGSQPAPLKSSRGRENIFGLVHCLRHLTSSPNSPLPQRAFAIFNGIFTFLTSCSTTTSAHVAAFATINSILMRISLSDASFVASILDKLLFMIRNLWRFRDSALRDQLLASLIVLLPHLERAKHNNHDENLAVIVGSLLDDLRMDYVQNEQRDRRRLLLDDLCLSDQSHISSRSILSTNSFTVRHGKTPAEYGWTVLSVMGFLMSWLDGIVLESRQNQLGTNEGLSRKRSKPLPLRLEELFGQLQTAPEAERVQLFQLALFAISYGQSSDIEIQTYVQIALGFVGESEKTMSSWASLIIAELTTKPSSRSPYLQSTWTDVWRSSWKNIVSASHCRTSCHTLALLINNKLAQSEVVDSSVQHMLSSTSLHGPALICDASIEFWHAVSNEKFAHSANLGSSRPGLTDWLLSKWQPSNFESRGYARQLAASISTTDLLFAFSSILGTSVTASCACDYLILGDLGQVWKTLMDQKPLFNYLFLLNDHTYESADSISNHVRSTVGSNPPKSRPSPKDDLRILSFLLSEAEKIWETLPGIIKSHPQSLNSDMVQALGSFCLVVAFFSAESGSKHIETFNTLNLKLDALIKTICEYLAHSQTSQAIIEDLMVTLLPILPKLAAESAQASLKCLPAAVVNLARKVAHAFKTRHTAIDVNGDVNGSQFDDFEPEHDSQAFRTRRRDFHALQRHELGNSTSRASFCASIEGHLNLIALLSEPTTTEAYMETALEEFTTFLTELSPAIFLATKPFLQHLLDSDLHISSATAINLLDFVKFNYLSAYEYERGEVPIDLCLQLMRGFLSLWSDASIQGLSDDGSDLFDWFVDKYPACSPRVQGTFSNLLSDLLDISPDYGRDATRPSVRTILLGVLRNAELSVQCQIADAVPKIFGKFILSRHEAIFDDVHDALPRDETQQEGIALRLLILAKLGSAWRTLLRRSVYHIFETAGSIPSASGHAKLCMRQIATSYNLTNTKELLVLFRSQLLFTWLDKDQANQTLETIPYKVFEFESLQALLTTIKSELVSQLAMRGDAEQIKTMENILNTNMRVLVTECFGQTMAYVFAKDASVKESDQNRRLETNILNFVGQSQYLSLIERELPRIIAYSLDHLQSEDQIAKYFAKREGFEDAAVRLEGIRALGGSNLDLPLAQQPSFKARYLPDTLSRLARRLRKSEKDLWTVQNTVITARMLLDGISDTLGSLHARRVLIRLNILVSLAPHVVSSGYPLQQLMHGIRPLTADQYCAPDAVCLLQYLFTIGQESLKQSPQFMLGTTLALQFSIKSFIRRPQEATTQESEHFATTMRVESFQKWLNNFTGNFNPTETPAYTDSSIRLFRNFLTLAKTAGSQANGFRDSDESALLKLLLGDVRTGRPSLSVSFRRLCFESFCRNFSSPQSYSEDIFGTEKSSERYMQHIWESCRQYDLPDAYLQWAAKALGRAFGSHGHILPSMGAESQVKLYHRISKSQSDDWSSGVAILRNLIDCLESSDALEIGAAECTLRRFFMTVAATDQEHILRSTINDTLASAFNRTNLSMDLDELKTMPSIGISEIFQNAKSFAPTQWMQHLAMAICSSAPRNSILRATIPALRAIPSLAKRILPFIVHLALSASLDDSSYSIDGQVSDGVEQLMSSVSDETLEHTKGIINCLLYLRTQAFPGELTRLERIAWVRDLDLELASAAAARCGMFKTATMLLEDSLATLEFAMTKSREEIEPRAPPFELLLDIFRQVDEPDSYYGIEQPSSLASLASRLDFEGKAVDSLTLHGAEADSLSKSGRKPDIMSSKLLLSLSKMNLNSLTQQLGSELSSSSQDDGLLAVSMSKSALKLRNWDLPAASFGVSSSGILYKSLRTISLSDSFEGVTRAVNQGLLEAMSIAISGKSNPLEPLRESFTALCALTEANDLLSSHYTSNLTSIHDRLRLREQWMTHSSIDDVSNLLSFRESFFGALTADARLQNYLHLNTKDKLLNEVEANLQSSRIYRLLGSTQDSLANVVYLNNISARCDKAGLHVSRAIQLETARVLWERGEQVPSIKMLQDLQAQPIDSSDAIELGRAGLLATLARSTSEARLEKPDEIMSKYLKEALNALGSQTQGNEAGRVFHEFASYCHVQLTSPDFLNEVERSEKFRHRKRKELQDLENLSKGNLTDQEKHKLRGDKAKVKKWLSIDDQDYKRIKETRDQFLRQSLENYMMSLAAWDHQDNDVLRFFALWLEHANEDAANDAVTTLITRVPSRKFVQLMNQLASRLQDKDSSFQAILHKLVNRICHEHPYHGMNYIFAGSKTEGGNDLSARSRHAAASKIAAGLQIDSTTSLIWSAISKSNELFINAASAKTDEMKQGAKLRLKNFNATRAVEREIPVLKVPPITTSLDIRENLDYTSVPIITGFGTHMTIAGGISTPKILTAISSNGSKHVQLYKAGSDDLRQDAIMEQVFEQVSALLKTNKATRQRDLRIRTYKVVPLNANAGAIEFVSNTTSLNDYLNDAHVRYHPSDLRWNAARRKIDGAKEFKLPARVQVYKEVASHFSPVLRHFFFENFEDPDEWFATRLAYTRSTAAISILGHVLGLGDRHCQNILLDRGSGEVVHIDLGVAFEAGRILNIPEVVPFRLTRDVVDGFGVTRTEGVFRRCCEFTLEALRANKDAIMTLLNVLRYDPLYSWSVSPLRAKKLQQDQEREMAALAPDTATSIAPGAGVSSITSRTRTSTRASAGQEELRVVQIVHEERQKKNGISTDAVAGDDDEGGEADRALSVVEKKLATGLSVQATVHELIQQATDERNLAVLFGGWAAFA